MGRNGGRYNETQMRVCLDSKAFRLEVTQTSQNPLLLETMAILKTINGL